MKKRLKKWVKVTMLIIVIILALLIIRNIQKAFIETCVKQGYSVDYCIKNS